KPTRTVRALLVFLLLPRDHTHRRDMIAGLLWSDLPNKQARNALSTTLWRLRQVLEPDGVPKGAYLLANGSDEIAFNCASDHWLDIAEFEQQTGRALAIPVPLLEQPDLQALERALDLYTGDLLPASYDDWALVEREQLRRLYLNSLAHLMRCREHRGEYGQALTAARRILDLDPLREEIHRAMMRLHAAQGQRARAVRQYDRCRLVLDQELGVSPMPETQALLAQIRRSPDRQPANDNPPAETPFAHALAELQRARQEFAQAQERLQRAIGLAERLASLPQSSLPARNLSEHGKIDRS
ncbi:MAG: hypothetical protein KDI55_26360, partial [Anaerolineae bacterium]|nr:hypothetical protein [Anaerolineae bacterium]